MSKERDSFEWFKRLKPLWVALTGSAFVGFAGGTVTLMYFWQLGGVPPGQAASLPALTKLVVATSFVLSGTLLALWLFPILLSRVFVDEEPFADLLRRFFTRTVPEHVDAQAQRDHHVAPNGAHAPATFATPIASNSFGTASLGSQVTSDTHLTDLADASARTQLAPSTRQARSSNRVAGERLLCFSLFTVGSGCAGLLLAASGMALGEHNNVTLWTWAWCLGAPAVITTVALLGMWSFFTRSANQQNNWVIQNGVSQRAAFWRWMAFGYCSAFFSVYPLMTLMLLFLKSERLLLSNSVWQFIIGSLGISLMLVMTFSCSLWVLFKRSARSLTQWPTIIGLNFIGLACVVVVFGLAPRLVDVVMIQSSLRVEHAVLMLEPEGCEILESIQAIGWGKSPVGSGKSCVLYDVTIQSTLDPAMQIACWRGIVDQRETESTQETESASVAASAPAASGTGHDSSQRLGQNRAGAPGIPSAPASAASAAPRSLDLHIAPRGSFSIPVKYVRSVWKTTGRQESNAPVCPSNYRLLVTPPLRYTSATSTGL